MARIELPTREQAPAETHEILDATQQRLGFLPNGLRLLSLSPSALRAYVGLQTALTQALDEKTREAVALAVSQANGCNYCIATHCFITHANSQTSPDEMTLNREGKSADPKRAAAAAFAKRIIDTHGKVSDADLAAVRVAGYSDGEIVELTVVAARYTLTNFLNNMSDVDIDIPAVSGMVIG
ncbi:MAG TPA: peroxidase-related enzyme [Acidobacteriaceae bacterium]